MRRRERRDVKGFPSSLFENTRCVEYIKYILERMQRCRKGEGWSDETQSRAPDFFGQTPRCFRSDPPLRSVSPPGG